MNLITQLATSEIRIISGGMKIEPETLFSLILYQSSTVLITVYMFKLNTNVRPDLTDVTINQY
jgi:hypothetical protein